MYITGQLPSDGMARQSLCNSVISSKTRDSAVKYVNIEVSQPPETPMTWHVEAMLEWRQRLSVVMERGAEVADTRAECIFQFSFRHASAVGPGIAALCRLLEYVI